MSVLGKKENKIEILWMNEVDGVISRLVKITPGDIIVVQQLKDNVWGTKGIGDSELQTIWNSIRSESKVPFYLQSPLQQATKQLVEKGLAWRQIDEAEPIGSQVPFDYIKQLAFAVDAIKVLLPSNNGSI